MVELGQVLQKVKVDVIPLVEFDNLFIVDYAIMPQKVGIMVQNARNSVYLSHEPTNFLKLKKQILRENGWAILDISWQQFEAMGSERLAWIEIEIQKLFEI